MGCLTESWYTRENFDKETGRCRNVTNESTNINYFFDRSCRQQIVLESGEDFSTSLKKMKIKIDKILKMTLAPPGGRGEVVKVGRIV